MAAGRDRSVGKNFTRKLKSDKSLDEDHIVLMQTAGVIEPCDNTVIPYAIGYRSTLDKFQNSVGKETFNTGADINAETACFRSGWAEIPLDIDHAAIAIGDMIIVGPADIGKVIKGDSTDIAEFLRRVGWAEETVAVPGGGLRTKDTVLVALDIQGGAP